MSAAPGRIQSLTVPVEGMSCASCALRVERALTAAPGVTEAHVNLAAERVDVRFDGNADASEIVRLIEEQGYHVPTRSCDAGC